MAVNDAQHRKLNSLPSNQKSRTRTKHPILTGDGLIETAATRRVYKTRYAVTRGLTSTSTLTYGNDFTRLIRDLHLYCMYPDTLPNFTSNFCLCLFRRTVYHCCRRCVPDPQEDF